MILSDLVSLINHAMPRLVAASARCAFDDEIFGRDIGYAVFRTEGEDASDQHHSGDANAWQCLRCATMGILGGGPTGVAVARAARRRFDSEVSFHDWSRKGDRDDSAAEREAMNRILTARVICVVLPWSEHQPAQLRLAGAATVEAQVVLVVWQRSPGIERALVYLGKHYAEAIHLRELADVACISKFHFVRRFTATLGITPHRYQLLLRLSQAKAMLREGAGITQIAHGVGFADHSHLNRSFRTLLGTTPTQYQRDCQRMDVTIAKEAISF